MMPDKEAVGFAVLIVISIIIVAWVANAEDVMGPP